MKKLTGMSIFLMTIFLVGCVTINVPPQAPTIPPVTTDLPPTPELPAPTQPPQGLSEEVLRNSEFLSPLMGVPVRLVDGKFSGEANGSPLNVSLRSGVMFGDLNRDGVNDAAFLLNEDTGGSGTFVSLVVIYSDAGQFRQAPGILINDRPIVNSLEIQNGVVVFSGFLHGPNDPMVNPTLGVTQEYSLLAGKIFLTRMSSAISNGGEHIIFINNPIEGDEVGDTARLIGSMPIGPFENNLSLQVIDPATGVLLHEGFLVQAPDMGAPATFDNEIHIPGVTSGTELLLVLNELSMADGSPMAIASVRVIAK